MRLNSKNLKKSERSYELAIPEWLRGSAISCNELIVAARRSLSMMLLCWIWGVLIQLYGIRGAVMQLYRDTMGIYAAACCRCGYWDKRSCLVCDEALLVLKVNPNCSTLTRSDLAWGRNYLIKLAWGAYYNHGDDGGLKSLRECA